MTLHKLEADEDGQESIEEFRQQLLKAFGASLFLEDPIPQTHLSQYFERSGLTMEQKGTCSRCSRVRDDIAVRRRGCQYAREIVNWAILCSDCQVKDGEYWEEQWEAYWSGRL